MATLIKFSEWKFNNCFFLDGGWFFNNNLNDVYTEDYILKDLIQIFKDKYYE